MRPSAGRPRLRPEGHLLGRARRAEARRIDAVGDVGDPLAAHPGGQQLVADGARHRHEAVGVAHQQVPEGDASAHEPGHEAGLEPRAPGIDLSRHLPVDLGLEHHALSEHSAPEKPGQPEHSGPPHHQDVEGLALAPERPKGGGNHAVLARAAGASRRNAQDPHAVHRLLGGPRRFGLPRDDGCGSPRGHERRPERANVLLSSAQDRMKGLGEEEHAAQREGRTSSRSRSLRRSSTA